MISQTQHQQQIITALLITVSTTQVIINSPLIHQFVNGDRGTVFKSNTINYCMHTISSLSSQSAQSLRIVIKYQLEEAKRLKKNVLDWIR